MFRYRKEYPSIKLYSYCLLPNHFHFLIQAIPHLADETDHETNTISKFMQKLQLSYAIYFRKKYGQPGVKASVFEGRFQSKTLNGEQYLSNLQIYIEYNAIKHGLVDKPEDWPYSSFDKLKHSEGFLPDDFFPVFE